jgi:hypothetical protein
VGLKSPDISMVERRTHVPARLHLFKGEDHPETCGVDWPSHINVFEITRNAERCRVDLIVGQLAATETAPA